MIKWLTASLIGGVKRIPGAENLEISICYPPAGFQILPTHGGIQNVRIWRIWRPKVTFQKAEFLEFQQPNKDEKMLHG